MTDIPNTEYITIDKDSIFVGGVHATHYRGAKIAHIDKLKEFFNNMHQSYPAIRELHVGSFDTRGKYPEYGNPSGKPGLKTWARVMFSNGKVGKWVFVRGTPPSLCAYFCTSPSIFALVALGGIPKMVKISKPGCYVMVPESFLQKVK